MTLIQRPAGQLAFLFGILFPCIAFALEQGLRTIDPGAGRFWATMGAVQLLALLGYAGSSLAQWAKWPDGTLLDRLTIMQGAVTSILAGNLCYYGGFYLLPIWQINLPEIGCFIATPVAGWGGDKFISPILARITGKIGGQS